jgi:hypothetical protein
VLADTARRLVGPRRAALGWGLAGALLLAVPDLARQLLVRDDPSRLHALLVDAVGFLSGGMLQLALVGLLAGEPARRWLTSGVLLLGEALRRRPGTVLTGLVAAGGVSALLTLPPSIAALGWRQVLGPLNDPSLSALAVAQLSDVVATALTAPYFALLVARCAGRAP